MLARPRALRGYRSSPRMAKRRRRTRRSTPGAPPCSALRALGVGRGDLVALVVADAEQFLTSFFGASMAGAVPASLYPPATTSDLPRYLERRQRCCERAPARWSSRARACAASRRAAGCLSRPLHRGRLRRTRRARHEPDRRPFARRHRLRAVHVRIDVVAERRRHHPSQPVGEYRRRSPDERPRGVGRTSRSAGCRSTTTWGSSAWRSAPSTRAWTRPADAAGVRQAPDRVAARDYASEARSASRRTSRTTCRCAV